MKTAQKPTHSGYNAKTTAGEIAELIPYNSKNPHGVRSYAIDPEKAVELWKFSEKATGAYWP